MAGPFSLADVVITAQVAFQNLSASRDSSTSIIVVVVVVFIAVVMCDCYQHAPNFGPQTCHYV
jgi:hypothetical protein